MSLEMNGLIRRGLPLACALTFAGSVAASAADCVTPREPGRVSLDCRAVPLGQVLRALAAVTPIDTKLIDSAAQSAPIHVALENGSVAQALQATLDAAGISFVLYGAEGTDLKVYASARDSSSSAPRTASGAVKPPMAESPDYEQEVPEVEDVVSIPEAKEAPVAPALATAPIRPDSGPNSGVPGLNSGGGIPGLNSGGGGIPGLTPNPAPAVTDGLKGGADPAAGGGRQGPPQTMEEILARSGGAAGGVPPEGKQTFSTMEEILARTRPPAKPQ
jgi:hypothetical protein